MRFEDLLNRRLGPMKDLLARTPKPPSPEYDPEKLFYRRALGLEFRFRPEDSTSKVFIKTQDRSFESMSIVQASTLCAINDWKAANEIEKVSAKKLWQWAQLGRLHFSRQRETARLSFEVPDEATIPEGPRPGIRLRPGVWPSLALENLVQISPIPFMPKRNDLEHSTVVGIRFSVSERGHEVMGLTITGSEKTGKKLQSLLPRLNGAESWKSLQENGDKMEKAILDALKGFGLLCQQERQESQSVLLNPETAQVTWLGHASVLVQMRDVNILADPLFFARSVPPSPKFRDQPFDPIHLPRIDAVLITHGDNDHLNPNSLAFLPRSTRIVVPSLQEPPADYQVDIRGLLRCMGFDNIVEMAPWSALIIDEVTICACPFEGEDWGLNLPQLTYLIYSDAGAVYCSADSQMMPETFEKLKAEHPPIDVAFMGVSGCAEPHAVDARFGYGNFYRDWIPVHQHQEWVRHCMGPEEVCEMLKIFEPSEVFGYAVGGADYIDIAYSDVGSHQELKKCLKRRELPSKALDLEIGVPYSWTKE